MKSMFVGLLMGCVLVLTAGSALAELVGYWKFDETSGLTAYDSSGYGRNATLSSGTGYKTPGLNQAGIIGRAYKFNDSATDNTKCFVRAPGSGLTGLTNFTLSLWVYMPTAWRASSSRFHMLFYGWDDLPDIAKSYSFYAQVPSTTSPANSRIILSVANDANANCEYLTPTSNFPFDSWMHIAGTYDGATERIFLNGVEVATKAYSIICRAMNQVYMCGYDGTSWGIRGYADDVGIWNETLSPIKVQALYNTPKVAELNTASTGRYGQKDMQDLFQLYDLPAHTPVTIGDKTWYYLASLPDPQGAGKAWHSGGEFFIQLGADGSGVSTIPEPSTMMLLACGLVGLLCYAWRKRK